MPHTQTDVDMWQGELLCVRGWCYIEFGRGYVTGIRQGLGNVDLWQSVGICSSVW